MPLEGRVALAAQPAGVRIVAVLDGHDCGSGPPFEIEEVLVETWDGDACHGGLSTVMGRRAMLAHLLGGTPEARSGGVGSCRMEGAEQEARTRGFLGVWLDTCSFQAPEFYAKLRFGEIGGIPGDPRGRTPIVLAKRLHGRPVLASDAPGPA